MAEIDEKGRSNESRVKSGGQSETIYDKLAAVTIYHVDKLKIISDEPVTLQIKLKMIKARSVQSVTFHGRKLAFIIQSA